MAAAYSIIDHRHRFSAWAASRAAASAPGHSFKVRCGLEIIKDVGLDRLKGNPKKLPSRRKLDAVHAEWRANAMSAAQDLELPQFTHGMAAKLINVYLKGMFVCAGAEQHVRVAALHPPIDNLLLGSLRDHDVGGFQDLWAEAAETRWWNLTPTQYSGVINAIRLSMGRRGMWAIEEYWRGYR